MALGLQKHPPFLPYHPPLNNSLLKRGVSVTPKGALGFTENTPYGLQKTPPFPS